MPLHSCAKVSGLAPQAVSAFLRAAREMRSDGTFTFAEEAASSREITAMFETGQT
jgi:hypothetical protein